MKTNTFSLTLLAVLLSVGSIHARIGQTKDGFVSPEIADSAFQSEKGDEPTDRVHIEHLDVRGDAVTQEENGENTEDNVLAAEKILQEAPGAAKITDDTNVETTSKTEETKIEPQRFAKVERATLLENSANVPAVPEFYPPPIMQAELERAQDDTQGVYLNPTHDTMTPGNRDWVASDNVAFSMSEQARALM